MPVGTNPTRRLVFRERGSRCDVLWKVTGGRQVGKPTDVAVSRRDNLSPA